MEVGIEQHTISALHCCRVVDATECLPVRGTPTTAVDIACRSTLRGSLGQALDQLWGMGNGVDVERCQPNMLEWIWGSRGGNPLAIVEPWKKGMGGVLEEFFFFSFLVMR